MQALQLTAVQADLHWEQPEANRQMLAEQLAAVTATDVIILPEMFSTGFSMNATALAEEMHGPSMYWMRQLAQAHDALVIGSLIIRVEDLYYNRCIAMDPYGLIATYDKRHLFRMMNEEASYDAGSSPCIITYKDWRINLQVCYDLRFPVWSRNRLDESGKLAYDLLIYCANWPTARISHWEALLKARAIENQAYVVGVNRVGPDGNDVPFGGKSVILDALGKPLAAAEEQVQLVEASIEPEPLERYRKKFPTWKDADGFQIMI